MDLTIRMTIFNKTKHCQAVCLKFGDRFIPFLNMLGVQAKASICTTTKENLPLYCRKLSAFAIAVLS